ncbi:MAG: fluoride efflux transporter CrcB [Cyanobacteria bacterium J06627_28]
MTVAPHFVPEVLQKPSIRNPIAVSLGAIAGSLSRYYISIWIAQKLGTSFPYGTVLINLTGSFAMGLLTTLVLDQVLLMSPELRLLCAVGFLGSYTTFSTFELDTITLIQGARFNIATVYWLGSAVAGSLSLYLGIVVARLMR